MIMLYGYKCGGCKLIYSVDKLKKCFEIERKIYYPNCGITLPLGIKEKDTLHMFILKKSEYNFNVKHKILTILYQTILQT